jgi:rare lipoprotein A
MKRSLSIIVLLITFVLLNAQLVSKLVLYDDAFEGEKTASGDLFSHDSMTAAHDSLPLGTRVELLYVQNGKRVTVTINDRLSDAPDLFWVTKAAAEKLELYSLHPVDILYSIKDSNDEDLGPDALYDELFRSLDPAVEPAPADPRSPEPMKERTEGQASYGVQVYSTSKRSDALTLSRRMQEHFDYLSYIERVKTENGFIYRLIIGDFKTRDEALRCYEVLHKEIPDIFIWEIY